MAACAMAWTSLGRSRFLSSELPASWKASKNAPEDLAFLKEVPSVAECLTPRAGKTNMIKHICGNESGSESDTTFTCHIQCFILRSKKMSGEGGGVMIVCGLEQLILAEWWMGV